MRDTLTIWTVYRRPKDFPGKWVLRAHDVPGGPRQSCEVADSLDEIMAKLPPGLYRQPRDPGDDPAIYETWF